MQYKLTGDPAVDARFFQKKRALEWEAKRLAREAAGEPKPVSPYTPEQIAQARVDLGRKN